MKMIKGWIPSTFLAVVMVFSTMTANAGILITGLKSETQCVAETKVDSGILITGGYTGILITGLTGILITGFTGILITGVADTSTGICDMTVNKTS